MKTCKYCGKEYKGPCKDTCHWCFRKRQDARRFAKARDELRRKCGLPPLEDNKL